MIERLIFGQSVEGLLRALGDKLDAPTARLLAEAGIDVYGKLRPSYPLAAWVQAVHIGARVVHPRGSLDEGTFELGRRFVRGYEDTLLGRGTLKLARLLGPKLSLQRLNRSFRNANNYTETRLVEISDSQFELWVCRVAVPEFIRGMCMAGLEVSGAHNPRVDILSHDAEGTTYRVVWEKASAPPPASGRRA